MHLLTWEILDGDEGKLRIWLERDANVSNYGILSHRWGDPKDEVSFEDILAGGHQHKKGYGKLLGCCKQAQKDGLRHVWVDTCCINKASSAELSEAITSMFTYYERSKVCYAFLEDVMVDSSDRQNLLSSSFPQSAWFTRGWTLQELIAPQHVMFFDGSWSFLGYKTDDLLAPIIESVTGIDSVVLNIPATTRLISISKRMSWAARRKTTRIEDRAYSLMGIFGVYMPPLYGEGNHAFIRLQEAIMKTSHDHTIFAWTSAPPASLSHDLQHVSTMLALSPDQFELSANFMPLSHSEHSQPSIASGSRLDYTITNAGLSIRLPLLKVVQVKGLYAAFLACTDAKDRIPSAILLRTTDDSPSGHFWRTLSNEGPIERSERRWLQISGREGIQASDVYILPRFTSISRDNIEPLWNREDIPQRLQNKGGHLFSGTKKPKSNPFSLNAEVLRNLKHVPDPSFQELEFLRQAYQMISTNQPSQLVEMTRTKLKFPKIIPWSRNKNFYGRAAVLQKIRDTFFPSDRALSRKGRDPTRCTISGAGGIGKTQIALEFVYECLENHLFDAVLWISAESTMAIHDGFRRFASALGLVEQEKSTDIVIREVLLWLYNFDQHANILSRGSGHSAKWLLVFDNVDDESLLRGCWPSDGPGCVLVTSRSSVSWFSRGSENTRLEPFTVQESSELFKTLIGQEWDFTAISERLGGLPLAIMQMADYMIRSQVSLTEFISIFDDHTAEVLEGRDLHQISYRHTVATVWGLDRLTNSSRAILKVISFLDPDLIQDSILIPSRKVALQDFPESYMDRLSSRTGLLSQSLISRSPDRKGLWVHRLLQDTVRTQMDPDEYQRALSTTVALVSSAWTTVKSNEQAEVPNSKTRDEFLRHVVSLQRFVTELTDSEDTFDIKSEFAKLSGYLDVDDAV